MTNPGDLIGKQWVVMSKLGSGGAGDVFRVKHRHDLSRIAAIKLLHDRTVYDRFMRERYLMERVVHENVVKLIDMGLHDDGKPYLVLEFVPGGSLDVYLGQVGTFEPRIAAWILTQVCAGMRAARTVHRDMKPANLLIQYGKGQEMAEFIVGDTTNGSTVKIADFGLAKPRASMDVPRLTQDDRVMGTPLYMAPEQCRNSHAVGVEADIYSCGVMLFEMVVGVPVFDIPDVHMLMAAHVSEEPYLPPSLTSPLREIIAKCLAKKPEDRYRSWRLFEDDLRQVCALPPTAPSTHDAHAPVAPPRGPQPITVDRTPSAPPAQIASAPTEPLLPPAGSPEARSLLRGLFKRFIR